MWETKLKSTGNRDAVLEGKDIKVEEKSNGEEGGAFKVQLKSTGNKDTVKAGKDVKAKKGDDNGDAPASKRI